MDRSFRKSPNPIAGTPIGERRRRVRQKLHTPVYASFNGLHTGMVVDLSELLDLHEDGFAVQTSERLEMNRAVALCLDLPETKSFIHGSGQVIWSDDTGRGGVRFSALPESSRHILREWLFANLLIACANHAARTEQLQAREEGFEEVAREEYLPEPMQPTATGSVVPIPDQDETLSSLEVAMEAVRREVGQIADDVDAVLRLITESALSLTAASGAAMALLTDDQMICRARAGEPVPPLGAPVDVNHGLSGECVRTALLVSCEDAENDPRIDPEVARNLGIASLLATPIVFDFRVVGLLEVFSTHPRAFTKLHGIVLERLVQLIPQPQSERDSARNSAENCPDISLGINAQTEPERMQPENRQPLTPIESEAMADAPWPRASQFGSAESVSIPAAREPSLEPKPEVAEQISGQVSGQIEGVPDPAPDPVPEDAPEAPSRLLYRALIGLVIVVVATVIGYVAGPAVDKRWSPSPQASQRPLGESDQAVPAVSQQSVSDRTAASTSPEELQKLAAQGDADAQWQLGVRYHSGEVPDDAQAVQWFQRAAEQGNIAAQSALGAYYWSGRGVPEDLSKAYFWSTIAMAQGDEMSKGRLQGLAKQMTPAQVSIARQQAQIWIRSHSQRAKSQSN